MTLDAKGTGTFEVVEDGVPNLTPSAEPTTSPDGAPAGTAPGGGPTLEDSPRPAGWTPDEAAALASGLTSAVTGVHAIVSGIPAPFWEQYLRGNPEEWKASAPTIARHLDAILPHGAGGPLGLVADAGIIGNDAVIVVLRRRAALSAVAAWRQQAEGAPRSNPPSRAAAGATPAAAQPPPLEDDGMSYRLPTELVAVAERAAEANGSAALGMMGYS